MIHEVDAALRSFLTASLPPKTKVSMAFDVPTAQWVGSVKEPTLDLFLHDVRENLDGRMGDWIEQRDDTGMLVGLQPPVRRYDLTYVVSAWGGNIDDQHRLLGLLLSSMPAYDDIPNEHLTGQLAQQGIAVRLRVGYVGSISDLWSSLGHPPTTALALVATMPVLPPVITDLAEPASSIDLGLAGVDGRRGKRPVPSFDEAPGSGDLKGTDGREGRLPSPPDTVLEDDPSSTEPPRVGANRQWTAFRTRETVTQKPPAR